ncbi:MAG: hypothetical protein M3015_10560 [Bacteroidota bacterium]|nr:hypothetical protein [Bacteroidota bacterium]
MLEIQVIEPFRIEPTELDSLLALGWFRMQQTIFTTETLRFYGQVYNAVWLRAGLYTFHPDKKYKALSNKNNRFKTEIKKAIITPAHESLYNSYKENILFDAAASLHSLLYGISTNDVYNTYMINVYDEMQLIGTGFFDLGDTSAAGICSIYDPAYKKYSLGKYMIYEKMLYCKNKNFQYFYPGYFVPGYAMFDYKLEIGTASLEYFDTNSKQWLPYLGILRAHRM